MNFKSYQEKTHMTLLPSASNITYLSTGMVAEVGEVMDLIAKGIRDKPKADFYENMKKELGDVLYFVSELAAHYKIDLDDVAHGNIDKLLSRKIRGKLQGSGDDR